MASSAFAAWKAGVAHALSNPLAEADPTTANEQLSSAFEAWKGLTPSDLSRIIGSWKLKSFAIHEDEDGTIVMYPLGEHAVGWLLYGDAGIMSGHLMKSSEDGRSLLEPSDAEGMSAAFLSVCSYCGTYTVDESAGTVNHQVHAASYPNWVNTDLVRKYSFSDDGQTLTLSTHDKCPPGMTARLVWTKAAASYDL